MGARQIKGPKSISPLGFKRVSSPKSQSSGGISEGVFTKEDGEWKKWGIDQDVLTLLLAKGETNITAD